MKLNLRRVAACVMVISSCSLLGAAAGRSVPSAQVVAAHGGGESQVQLSPEVRLRKLHLVRPDLMNYPVSYEVLC